MADPRQVIADILRDYRTGRVTPITPDRVGQWADQFPEHRDAVLSELAAILPGAYYSRSRVIRFLSGLMTTPELTGPDARTFWRSLNLLEIQPAGKGSSQRELVALLRESIAAHHGPAQHQGVQGGPYLYLDDGVFTGITTIRDIRTWLATAPTVATLHIITIVMYRQGYEYARDQIAGEARRLGKQLTVHWRCDKYLENSFGAIDESDVLWPMTLPAEGAEYARTLKHSVQLRRGNSLGTQNTFATHDGRVALEQAFVKAGVKIRTQSPFNDYQRPLGNIVMESMGFGALFATYRNCPNNAPLALWAGSPWIPLLPRQNNQ